MGGTAGTEFLGSMQNVFEEAQGQGFTALTDFRKLTGSILKFLPGLQKDDGCQSPCQLSDSLARWSQCQNARGIASDRPESQQRNEQEIAGGTLLQRVLRYFALTSTRTTTCQTIRFGQGRKEHDNVCRFSEANFEKEENIDAFTGANTESAISKEGTPASQNSSDTARIWK
ncbi:hypothetical protein J3458_000535 [Metarhizium acridum]|uniref:uncharacterized protein n=1 Tax=Metarhizium acridum TaxID=92637 RepID=UPI001C6C5EB1|nr:hypothetical protein J3458_000535 [Metarhizium acridum]